MEWICTYFLLIHFLLPFDQVETAAVEMTVRPQEGCICPDHSYACRASSVTEIEWDNKTLGIDGIQYETNRSMPEQEREGLRVLFSEVALEGGVANLTAQLFVIDQHRWNRSNVTCKASGLESIKRDTVTICVTGPASPPTGLSVVCDSSSAVVSFQSPVYGGECVDYYVVTAVSGERNMSWNVTSDGFEHNRSVNLDGSANDYRFTVYAVTFINSSFFYKGDNVSDCCLPFPENITAVEERCGHINVSWEISHNMSTSVATTISWVWVHSSGGDTRHYERASSEDSHLLTLDYSETGPVEISVTFSSHLCNKTTVIFVNIRNCQTSTGATQTPTPDDVHTRVTETIQPTPDSKDTEKYIGAGVGAAAFLIVVATTTVVLLVLLVERHKSKSGVISRSGDKMNILGSPQVSVEEGKRSCDPPQTPAPAIPESKEESRPDVVPSLYAELDTLTRQKKEEPAALPMYHVLEGPTPVETTPDTQESETSATDAPVYAMVDKSKKKKKNKGSESSATATPPASDIPVYSVVDKSKKKKNRGSKPSATITEKEEEEGKEGKKEGEEKEEVTSI